MKASDAMIKQVKQSIGKDINAGGDLRTKAAEVLSVLIQKDYPNMDWQHCQYLARDAVNYQR